MNEFRTLRAQARRERDETIAHAKQRCKEALAQIAALKAVMAKPKKPLRPIRREPSGSDTLRQAMIDLLGDRSMTPIELAVAIRESGYATTMTNRRLCQQVLFFLRRDERFKQDGEKWTTT